MRLYRSQGTAGFTLARARAIAQPPKTANVTVTVSAAAARLAYSPIIHVIAVGVYL